MISFHSPFQSVSLSLSFFTLLTFNPSLSTLLKYMASTDCWGHHMHRRITSKNRERDISCSSRWPGRPPQVRAYVSRKLWQGSSIRASSPGPYVRLGQRARKWRGTKDRGEEDGNKGLMTINNQKHKKGETSIGVVYTGT